MNNKYIGELAEIEFLKKAYEKGFVVSKPFGDNAKYDYITEKNSILKRIQVKSTASMQDNRYKITCGSGLGSKKIYNNKEIDVLAAYVFDCNCWYLIPIKNLNSITISLYPNSDDVEYFKNNCCRDYYLRYEEYRNKWNILTDETIYP